MNIENVKLLTPFERFCYFINERYLIYKARKAGKAKPWTDDEILQNYRFCNVRRMNDKVSAWLLENWYTPNYDHKNMLVACVVARHFNKPETLQRIGFDNVTSVERMRKFAKKIKAEGSTVFNAAYIISGGTGGPPRAGEKRDKIDIVLDAVIAPIIRKRPPIDTDSMKLSVKALVPYRGIGWFMAGQIIADARHAMSGKWDDRLTWAPMGPGSRRGLNRVKGLAPNAKNYTQAEFVKELNGLRIKAEPYLLSELNSIGVGTEGLEAIDFQNCLCELDKMERALWGEGRPKQVFKGR